MKRPRKIVTVLFILILAGALLWRGARHFVPPGVKPTAFLFASTEEKSSTSPRGRTLYYRFNDAGAAHSGYHYTWCYTDHWLTGKRVIAGGYSEPSVRQGEVAFPLIWHEDGRRFSVRFAAGRRDATIVWFSGSLP